MQRSVLVPLILLIIALLSIVGSRQEIRSVHRDDSTEVEAFGVPGTNSSSKNSARGGGENTTTSSHVSTVKRQWETSWNGTTTRNESMAGRNTSAVSLSHPGEKYVFNNSNISAIRSHSRYAYVFAIWRLDPENKAYKGYLSSILVSNRLLRTHGSQADVVVVIKIHYDSQYDQLPAEDVQLLEQSGIRIYYLPKHEDDRHLNIYATMFHKFTIFNMTNYRYVMYLDADLMPVNNLDYLMEMADEGILKNNLVIASNREPSNGGMIMVQPNATAYRDIQNIIEKMGTSLGKGKEWDEVKGWGHTIKPPDRWETNTKNNVGTRWSFWAANVDQGFIYHYCKYVLQDCTQILSRKVLNFGKSPINGTTIVEKEWIVTSKTNSPFAARAPKKAYTFSGSCGYMAGYSGSSKDWPGCVPPYRDFHHFTGRSKPWRQDKPPIRRKRDPKSIGHLWWHTLVELRDEEGLNASALGILLPY